MLQTFTGRYWLTFDVQKGQEPVLYQMSRKFDVVFNIRQATMNHAMCLMALELSGKESLINEVLEWFKAQGVQVDPIEISTIEG